MQHLSLGYSPCPNDTFIFHALVQGKVSCNGIAFNERLEDVETLNKLALQQQLDLTKISYHAFGHLRENYALLRSGGALGRGCGPLVVAADETTMDKLRGKRIAIPGRLTTANLLLQLYSDGYEDLLILPFDRIMAAVTQGQAAAGVIIHESRFTYQQHGLFQVQDLGQWWKRTAAARSRWAAFWPDAASDRTDRPNRCSTPSQRRVRIQPSVRRTTLYQTTFAGARRRRHPQPYQPVRQRFLTGSGDEGIKAVETLLSRAEERGIIPTCEKTLFTT